MLASSVSSFISVKQGSECIRNVELRVPSATKGYSS